MDYKQLEGVDIIFFSQMKCTTHEGDTNRRKVYDYKRKHETHVTQFKYHSPPILLPMQSLPSFVAQIRAVSEAYDWSRRLPIKSQGCDNHTQIANQGKDISSVGRNRDVRDFRLKRGSKTSITWVPGHLGCWRQ